MTISHSEVSRSIDLVAVRRHLHAHPELSFEEHETAAYIEGVLRDLGVDRIERYAETGVVALIEGAHEGPTLGWRSDIDALPIQEAAEHDYCSTNDGVMHACGHDVHTTLGLGVAERFIARRDELHGRIKIIFQPAEEASPTGSPIGAEQMAVEGALEDPKVDAIFAMHCMPTLEAGKIGYTGGPVWARSELIEIEVLGEKTHAAYPHSGIDAVVVASHLIVALQTITSRRVDARKPCVISIGSLEAGNSYNIIAERAKLTGIMRTLDDEVAEEALQFLRETIDGVCKTFGTDANVNITPGARLTANHVGLETKTVELLREVTDPGTLVAHLPQMGAEDFAAFSSRVPACYLFLGVRNEERGIKHMLHTARFDVDERCLPLAVDAMADAMLGLGRDHADFIRGLA